MSRIIVELLIPTRKLLKEILAMDRSVVLVRMYFATSSLSGISWAIDT